LSHPFGVLSAWDGLWYRRIAEHGYLLVPGRQSDTAFFPLYPALLRVLHRTGLPLGAAGLLLANLVFLLALLLLYELGLDVLPVADARRAVAFAAVFPTGYVFSMLYPESVVLACIGVAALLALRGRWLGCSLAAAAATLARPEGALLALPIAAAAAARWRTLDPDARGRALAAIAAGPAALLAFALYLGWALHDPFAWSEAQRAWGRSFQAAGVVLSFRRVVTDIGVDPWGARDLAFCLVDVALIIAAARAGIRRAWVLFGLAVVLLPLTSGTVESDARFGLLAVPVYWGLAVVSRRRWVERSMLAASAALLVAATATIPLVFP
jgi:hypothetical protein